MSQYTVTITDSRLKMNFSAHCIRDRNHYLITLHEIIFSSLGLHREGLSIGDRLVAINDRLVCDMTIAEISGAFAQLHEHLPLNLTLSPQSHDPGNRRVDRLSLSMSDIAPPSMTPIPPRRSIHRYTARKFSLSRIGTRDRSRSPTPSASCATYIRNRRNVFVSVFFDRCSVNRRNRRVCLVASKGFRSGCHSWSIELVKCGISKQEIGVVGMCDVERVQTDDDYISGTAAFGARAVFGDDLEGDSVYYASYDKGEDNRRRCFRNLDKAIGWSAGDVITVSVDLSAWKVKFLQNGEAVGKCMSLQPNQTYYPAIAFAGDCRYAVR